MLPGHDDAERLINYRPRSQRRAQLLDKGLVRGQSFRQHQRARGIFREILGALRFGRAERGGRAGVQVERADRFAVRVQRQGQAGADAARGRLRFELGPARLVGGVLDAHHVAVAHGVQARAVVEFVLHLVHPCGDRIAARHGDRPPFGQHGHPARQAAAHQLSRQYGQFVQELLDALGAVQCAAQFLQFFRVFQDPGTSAVRPDISSELSRHQHTHLMDTRPRTLALVSFSICYPLPAIQTPASGARALSMSECGAAGVSTGNRVIPDLDKSYRSARDGRYR